MRRYLFLFLLIFLISPVSLLAQGWPAKYGGVMLQGFYWDSYSDSQWSKLESEADELSQYFKLIWVPNSAYCNTTSYAMGYAPVYWYNHLSCFGNEAQLRSMINTYKAKGTGIIEDVVINHRNGVTNWTDFPAETVDGKTWKLTAADICNNDEVKSATGQETPTGAADTGDNFDGCRDLDHTSTNVQNNVINYLKYLKDNLGYAGFRYDMVKGYGASYISKYNHETTPDFSVGEYWDDYGPITNWLNGTKDANGKIQSAAFDFPLKFVLNNAFNNSSWSALTSRGIVGDANYRRYAVTFVDNHDTYRSNALNNNVLAANAFMLALPGTPCVFLPHWQAYKQDIKQMILARQLAGITNESTCGEVWKDNANTLAKLYAVKTTGEKGSITVIVGNGYGIYDPAASDNMQFLMSGTNYAIYISKNLECPWTSVPSGTYESAINVTLTAITQTTGVKLVYTTDGTEPTDKNGIKVLSGTTVKIPSTTTLKVGIINGSTVSNVTTRDYVIKPYVASTITIYAQFPSSWTTKKIYTYTSANGTDTPMQSWPGLDMTETTSIAGETWYYKTFTKPTSSYNFTAIFNNGNGGTGNQSANITGISSDKFYKVYVNGRSIGYSDNTSNYQAHKDSKDSKIATVKTGDATSLLSGADCQSTVGWSNVLLAQNVVNWNGTTEKVFQPLSSDKPFQLLKDMPQGTYTVQAIVRGGNGDVLQMAVNDSTESETLSGSTDGAVSTVSAAGSVEKTVTGTNNGWHKIQQSYTLANDGDITVAFKLLSGTGGWQVGSMKLLYHADGTDATSYQTMATVSPHTTFVDLTGKTIFSFFDRGVNKNCLVKAVSGTNAASLPCNTIVEGTCSNLQLTDGNYDFGTSEAFTATTSGYNRPFDTSEPSTVFLPFALSASEVSAAGNFYSLSDYDAATNTITFSKVTETTANTPYLFIPAASTTPFAQLSGKEVPVTSPNNVTLSSKGLTFKGVYTSQTLKSSTTETLYGYRSTDGTFVKIGQTNGAKIKPFRAYLSLSKTTNPAAIFVNFDDAVTGITDIHAEKSANNQVYNACGQLISRDGSNHLQGKGIYIMNGKKVIIK